MKALMPHIEPTWLDLVGYGEEYERKMKLAQQDWWEIRLALHELCTAPPKMFIWERIP